MGAAACGPSTRVPDRTVKLLPDIDRQVKLGVLLWSLPMRPSDLEWLGRTDGEPGAPTLRWLGTAGFALEHEGHVVLFDPYLTRASLARCLLGPVATDRARVAEHVPRASAIVVGHTHFDHALDVPDIAKATGARVFGSRSAVVLCRARGVDEAQLEDVESRVTVTRPFDAEVGPFRLRFFASAHSPIALGRVPFPGEIASCDDVPMRIERYRCGAVFGVLIEVAGRRVFHLGSANMVDAALDLGRTDLALVCVAGWHTTPRFADRLVARVAPERVVLSHWDDFFRPLDRPLRTLPAIRFGKLVDALGEASRDVRVCAVPVLRSIAI